MIKPYPVTEAAFQGQVVARAEELGWEWMHIPRSQTGKRFRTMATGTMAKGWPDLVLCRGEQFIVIELKTDKGFLSDSQARVGRILKAAIPWYVLKPQSWDLLEAILA